MIVDKTIQIKDSELMFLSDELVISMKAAHYWENNRQSRADRFWNKVSELYPDLDRNKVRMTINHESYTLSYKEWIPEDD